jgi:hypothetical protein
MFTISGVSGLTGVDGVGSEFVLKAVFYGYITFVSSKKMPRVD